MPEAGGGEKAGVGPASLPASHTAWKSSGSSHLPKDATAQSEGSESSSFPHTLTLHQSVEPDVVLERTSQEFTPIVAFEVVCGVEQIRGFWKNSSVPT